MELRDSSSLILGSFVFLAPCGHVVGQIQKPACKEVAAAHLQAYQSHRPYPDHGM